MVNLGSIQAQGKYTAAALPVITSFGGRTAFLFATPRGCFVAVLLAISLGDWFSLLIVATQQRSGILLKPYKVVERATVAVQYSFVLQRLVNPS